MILTGMILAVAFAQTAAADACGVVTMVRDRGLERQWVVERDRRHPERPALLVEVPWSEAESCLGQSREDSGSSAPAAAKAMAQPAPLVRAGMRVTVLRHGENAEIELNGTALGTGGAGQTVAVRAGLSGTTIVGIVRGPGVVELTRKKGGAQ